MWDKPVKMLFTSGFIPALLSKTIITVIYNFCGFRFSFA